MRTEPAPPAPTPGLATPGLATSGPTDRGQARADAPVPGRERLRRFLVRFWPHACGFSLTAFWALAERQSWHQTLDRPLTTSLWGWWASRGPAPIQHLDAEPYLATLMLAILVPLILLHAVFPRWWLAPLSLMATFGWFLWGTIALGRLGIVYIN